jgi:hypothetical protein
LLAKRRRWSNPSVRTISVVRHVLVLIPLVVACSAAPTPTPSAPPGQSGQPDLPFATPFNRDPYIASIMVGGPAHQEAYQVRLTDPADIEAARLALSEWQLHGTPGPTPNGRVVRGSSDVNTGYSWHIDPDDFAFADVAPEACDGWPSDVENGPIPGDRFCPRSARVVALFQMWPGYPGPAPPS